MKKKYNIEDSWLNSDSFLKRAFAHWGYTLAAVGIVYLGLMVTAMFFALLSAMASF